MPSIDDEAEFELLDSIFADIDEATLSGLSQTKAKVPTKQNNVHTAKSYTSTAVKAGLNNVKKQTQREPLGPGRSNVLSSLSQASRGKQAATNASLKPSLGQLPTKTKVYSQTSAATSASPSRAWKSTGAIKPIPTKPAKTSALPNNKPFQRTSQAALVLKPQPTVAHFKPKEDDDLLAGIDWSDDEAPSLESQSQKSRKIDKGKAKEITEPDVETLARIKTQADPNYIPFSRRFTRCIVLSVTEKVVKDFRREKTVIVEVERTKECRRVLLFDEWATTEVEKGDIVNVIGDFVTKPAPCSTPSTSAIGPEDDLPTCTLSYSSSNLFILLPDTLISATRASDAHFCRRKAVIQEKIRSSSDATPALVYGNLLHELFQSCFLAMAEPSDASLADKIAEAFSLARREAEIDRLLKLPKNIESLFTIHVELDEARNHLREKSVTFTDFARQFLGQTPKPEAFLSDPRSRNADVSASTRVAISAVHDIEEDVWSPRLGLKGKIDASVHGTLLGPSGPAWPLGKEDRLVMPFEIKTGRNTSVMQHRAQTMLYTQMMADRYDRTIESGLLYYTQTNSLIRVEPVRNELRGLVIGRNDLARYLTPPPIAKGWATADAHDSMADISLLPLDDSPASAIAEASASDEDALWGDIEEADLSGICSQPTTSSVIRPLLPAAIDELKSCKKCYAADACTLYRRAIDNVKFIAPDDDPLQQSYDDRVGHLTDTQSAFFKAWENLISLEEREMLRFKKEIWTMSAGERERHGRCFSNMIVDPYFSPERYRLKATSSYRYTYRLKRASTIAAQLSTQVVPYSQSQPPSSQNDYIGKPLTSGHMSIGDPVVVSLEPSVLALARGYILDLKPDYAEVGLDHSLSTMPGGVPAPQQAVFRVDKDELQAGMGKIRENLANLFYANGDMQRRKLVVDLEKPRFSDPDYKPFSQAEKERAKLNEDQVQAVEKVLKTQDYALILGMPGTGKTTTIAEIIKALTARGKTVLLTSYTHSAVDNILMKIKDLEINILRLGQIGKVMPALGHLTLAAQEAPTSIAQLEQRLFAPQVVATTALGIDHPIFTRRRFDYCIVDEASQITLPICLGPLRYADRFILVGDHKQLPPLVKNPMARKEGLEISLFRRLSEAHPEAMVYLRHQYRMNADIMAISNRLVYENTLICGTTELASKSMDIKLPNDSFQSLCSGCVKPGSACWLRDVVDASRHVVFMDTDQLPAREQRLGRLVQNEMEAQLVKQTTTALLSCGVSEDRIGVITLYRQQIKLLEDLLGQYKGVEILTADKSQGRDKDCIVMSLTRSNAEKHVGDLIKDWRRLNVCFTRARYKLIIFGSKSTLEGVPHMQEFFELASERNWIYEIPAGSNINHTFNCSKDTFESEKSKVIPATAPSSRSILSSQRPFAVTSNSAKRPASTAPPVAGTLAYSPSSTKRSADAGTNVDHSARPSPISRPQKIRKTATMYTGKLGSEIRIKARPVLRDILDSL